MGKNLSFILHQLQNNRRFCILRGGTRSGKTYDALQSITLGALGGMFKICSVVAPTIPHIKRGALRDFLAINSRLINNKIVKINEHERIAKYVTGSIVEFFSSDSPDKLRSAGRDWLFLNEANTHDVAAFDELEPRTRKFIIIDFNPVAEFWLNERLPQMGVKISDNEIVTTYLDNEHLSKEYKKSIEQRKNIKEWWQVFGEAKYGEAKGRAWYSWHVSEFDTSKNYDIIGVDFGAGASPTAIVGLRRDGENILAYEINYGNISIKEIINTLKATPAQLIVGDSAQRDMINMLRKNNIDIYPCRKYTLSASYIMLNNITTIIHKDSINLIKEAKALEWADRGRGLLKAGQSDHAIDALRYALHEIIK